MNKWIHCNTQYKLLSEENNSSPSTKVKEKGFLRNFSGNKNNGSQTNGNNNNPFLVNDDEEDNRIEILNTNVDCYACDVSTQTDKNAISLVHRRENCKLMWNSKKYPIFIVLF